MAILEQTRGMGEEQSGVRSGNNGATEQLKAKTGEIKSDISANIVEISEIARKVVDEKMSELETKKDNAVRFLEGRVQEKPMQTICAAAGVGLLLGMFFRR